MRILPRPTWVLSVIAFLVFATILVVDGTVRGGVGVPPSKPVEKGSVLQVPFVVTHGRQIVEARTTPVQTFALKKATIALTFDGGPEPGRTAELLAVLEHFHVPATFFVDGSVGVQHPDSLRDIAASGSELGIRTFNTLELTSASPSRIQRETTLTQLTLAGATGQTTYLARPPFSASVAGLDDTNWAVVQQLAAQGFVTVFSDVNANNWAARSTDDIVKDIVRNDQQGMIIGIDASQGGTAQLASALGRVIPALQKEGYAFNTVTGAAGLPPAPQNARERDQRIGQGMTLAVSVATHVVDALGVLLLVTGALVILRLALMLIFAIWHAWRRNPKRFSWGPRVTEPVSVIVPAYNEKECIAATINSLRASDHPIEIVVVDDGSTDETAAIVRGLNYRNVRLVRQANGGKPAALNNGIRHARNDIVVMIDGDTVFEPKTISTLVQPFSRPWVGAVSGNAKVANRKKIVGRWQHIEYVIGFNIDRRIQDLLGCMTTIPGAVGAFRRKRCCRSAASARTPSPKTPTSRWRSARRAGRSSTRSAARAWTEAPTTLQQLWRQRYRWSYGTIQAMWKHRGAIFKSGPAGRDGPGRPAQPGDLPGAAARARPADRRVPDLRPAGPRPDRDHQALAGRAGHPDVRRAARVRDGAGEPASAAVDAVAAAGLPPADVRRFDQVAGHCPRRGPAEVAEAQASRRLRRPRRPWRCAVKRLFGVLIGLTMVALTACSTTVPGAPTAATGSPAAARPAFGAYLDISVKQPDLADVAKQAGLKHVNLAFALANNGACDPAWGGNQPIDALKPQIDAFRAAGGSVSAATGGAVGNYLENACATAADLAGAYTKLLDATGTNLLDVDIETGVDTAKVVDALGQVQRARGTDITLTLPVDLGGLPAERLDLVQKAAAANVPVTVNIMDMNFKTGGNWGQAMVDAAQASLDQLRKVYPNASEAVQNRTLSITVMIGRNDVGVITQPDDAQKVIDFAKSRGVGRLGFWALARDNGSCAKKVKAQPNCSGIAQKDWQFTQQFAVYTGPTAA